MTGDLITLVDLKTALGISQADTSADTQLAQQISALSAIFRTITGRSFGLATATELRTFEYDGSGYLDIDDATAITDVTLSFLNASDIDLLTTQWHALPPLRSDNAVFQYIKIYGYVWGDPAMGFAQNLDVYIRDYPYAIYPVTLKVTGTWGWPTIPLDIQQAMAWTIADWRDRADGDDLTSESIESYSRAWGGRSGSSAVKAQAISNRSLDILAAYERIYV